MSVPALGYNDLLATISADPGRFVDWTYAFLHREGLAPDEAIVMYDQGLRGRVIWVPHLPVSWVVEEPIWKHWVDKYYPQQNFPKFKLQRIPKPINFGWTAPPLRPLTNTAPAAFKPRSLAVSAGDQNQRPHANIPKACATVTTAQVEAPEPAGMVAGTPPNHASDRSPTASPARLPTSTPPAALLLGNILSTPLVAGPSRVRTQETVTPMSTLQTRKRARDEQTPPPLPSPKRARVDDSGSDDWMQYVDLHAFEDA